MKHIRILLGELAFSLRKELTPLIAVQEDMEVVGAVDKLGIDLLLEVRRTKADIVVLEAGDEGLPGECSHLLSEFPDLKILAVRSDEGAALLYELRPYSVPVIRVGAEDLIEAIRGAMSGGEC